MGMPSAAGAADQEDQQHFRFQVVDHFLDKLLSCIPRRKRSCSFIRPEHNNITHQAMHHQILHKIIRPTSKPDQLRPVEARLEIQKSYILMAPLFCSNSGSRLEGVVQIPRGSIYASTAASAAGGGIIILTCMIFEIRSTNSLHS